ncbi:oxidoreductase [Mycobacterium sp. IS-1742]|uniref:FAD-dependent oxidoreductase n=1 Tax=Mycobacterium sp. IS-1742 TaxID=1772285 RepID=UPI00073FC242|nr:FAD-dependent oxidoreductase [Mycobacterium sp. IS-1742]KUI31322.1 oxidoreductase [Mycobacterium sp. IS-1742]
MTGHIPTPASCRRRRTVAVLGGGVAGLTAAHELADRGFDVTVYEPRGDERTGLGSEPPACYPPVKLGGLAASQYSTAGTHDGSNAELRPFPGRPGTPRDPGRAVAGEHGFRFFPAYYLHIWDLFQRIPVHDRVELPGGDIRFLPTSRTVFDNVRRVVTQGTTVEGKPSLVFPREAPRDPAEFLGTVRQLRELGFTEGDVTTFMGRLLRYLVTSPRRRAEELQNVSAYDFFVGRDRPGGAARFSYTPQFDVVLREMPKVLAAFDSNWGDARTNLTTYLQLQLRMDRRDNKADGVLNGPTTEAWFDHWYRHLTSLGVRFVRAVADRIDAAPVEPGVPPHRRARVSVTLADGTRLTPDYVVVAVDAPEAERITAPLRTGAAGGTVSQLAGFTTSIPPETGPLDPAATRPTGTRNPYALAEMGRVPWDRFQTLGGIQYFFDTEFQLLRGHMYYSGSEWALSSINQHGMWERRPTLARDGHVSVLSVDIGDFNATSEHVVDAAGRPRAARDCTADEIAAEVWRQIVTALTGNLASPPTSLLPTPAWYALDRGLIMADGPGQGTGPPVINETPYLVPIIGDWENRPGGDPWNPHGTSYVGVPPEDAWFEDLEQRNVWQARHGGYQVHNNSLVFAGTWAKTFTRMTSMEAACESGRHAVNAILDHYIWVESDGHDRRDETTLEWLFPYGFLDQGQSTPIRMPTPAGDYCYVFDIENREPPETRALRVLDSRFSERSLPHPLDALVPPTGGSPMTTPPFDMNQQLLAYLQAWRQLLEQWTAMAASLPGVGSPYPPGAPGGPAAPGPADYTQQLFGSLQAWRRHLEQAAAATAQAAPQQSGGHEPDGGPSGAQASSSSGPTAPPEYEYRPPGDYWGSANPAGQWGAQKQKVIKPPQNDWGTVGLPFRDIAGGLDGGRAPQGPMPPPDRWSSAIDRFRPADVPIVERPAGPVDSPAARSARSAFRDATAPANPGVAAQATPKTLYRSLIEQRDVRGGG